MKTERATLLLTITCLVILLAGRAVAQDPDYVLSLSDADGDTLATTEILFSSDGDPVEAWSFDVCHDGDQVAIFASDVEMGAGIEDLVFSVHRVELHEEGFSVVAVLDADENTLGVETDLELYVLNYLLLDDVDSTISFCGDYEAPNVVVDGEDVEPTTNSAELDSAGGQLLYVPDATVLFDDDEVTLPLNFVVTGTSIQSWSGGICHDDDYLDIGTGDVDLGSDVSGRSYLFETIAIRTGGWTFGAILSPLGGGVLSGSVYELYSMNYELEDVGASDLEICNTLGSPAVAVQILEPGATEAALELRNGTVDIIEELPGTEFIRGDIDGNGEVSPITDALRLLTSVFGDNDDPPCADASDVDGNNAVSGLIDSLFLLRWGFSDGAEPPSPGPTVCGPDDDEDDTVLCETPSDGCE